MYSSSAVTTAAVEETVVPVVVVVAVAVAVAVAEVALEGTQVVSFTYTTAGLNHEEVATIDPIGSKAVSTAPLLSTPPPPLLLTDPVVPAPSPPAAVSLPSWSNAEPAR
jgi:hypothetical protein